MQKIIKKFSKYIDIVRKYEHNIHQAERIGRRYPKGSNKMKMQKAAYNFIKMTTFFRSEFEKVIVEVYQAKKQSKNFIMTFTTIENDVEISYSENRYNSKATVDIMWDIYNQF